MRTFDLFANRSNTLSIHHSRFRLHGGSIRFWNIAIATYIPSQIYMSVAGNND